MYLMYQNHEHHSLAYLRCVQNTYITLRLGKIIYHKAHFIIEYRMPHVTYCTCMLSHCVCVCVCVCVCWTVARQASLSMGFSSQEYWSGLPYPPPGDLPDSWTEPASLMSPALAVGYFPLEPPGKFPFLPTHHTQ